jgi:2-polyprenyl-6-methoxyphenol hydroxylase-like FAD-dependent oxidoreductase
MNFMLVRTLLPSHFWIGIVVLFASTNNLAWSLSSDPFGATAATAASRMNSESQQRRPNAIVVGAGLSGLAVSLGLVELGFTVDLVEKRSTFGERGATFGLRPNGLNAITELCGGNTDIASKLQGIGIPTPQRGGLMLPWATVRDALLEPVQQRARSNQITLHMGMELCDIQDEVDADCVTATFRPSIRDPHDSELDGQYESTQSMLTLNGCVVLGCDGVGSSVRQWLELPPATPTGVTMWRGSISVPENPHHVLTPLLSNGIVPLGMRAYGPYLLMVFNFHTSIPNTMAWTLSAKNFNPDSSNKDDASLWSYLEPHVVDDEDRRIVRELLALTNPADLNRLITLRTIDPSATVPTSTVMDGAGWGGRGRVTVLADAAHAMRPASGVGGAMAFEDCVVLHRLIREAIKENAENANVKTDGVDWGHWFQNYHTVADVLQRFETERLPRVTKIWNREWEASETAYKTGAEAPFSQEYNDYVNAGV